jgi:predicted Zn-dependent protease
MVASTRRGILVSRLGNLAILDPRTCLVTGVTGNGTLLIEKGKLTSALHNLRFVQNLVQVFNQVEMIGDETHLFGGLWGGTRVPALKVQDFGILGSNIGQG